MRTINNIILHITASNDNATIPDILKGHLARGFKMIGYHIVIDRSGKIHYTRPLEIVGSHCQGFNANSVGISYVARGSDTEPNAPYGKFMTAKQKEAFENVVAEMMRRFNIPIDKVKGHNKFNKGKACPCFDTDSKDFKVAVLNKYNQAEAIEGIDVLSPDAMPSEVDDED